MKKEYIIPIFVPHWGCKKCCTFCNQRTISGEKKQVTADDVRKTIDYYLSNFKTDKNYVEVAFLEVEKQEELLQAVQPYIKSKKVNSIRLSTRPDAIDKPILKMLKKYHVKTIELGVQSSNNYILARCKRGHSFEDVIKASKLIRWYGFNLGHQMMVGLPDSSEIDDIQTAKDCIKLKPKMVRIYPVLVIKGTELEQEFNKGEFTPLTVGQAVERSKEILKMFNKKHIQVIRVGLQNTDEISDPQNAKSEVVDGPYHPAFRQLVESSLWCDSIIDKIKKLNVKVKEVEVTVNPIDANNVIGHKKENIKKLKEIYEVDLKIKQDEKMKQGKSKIEITKTFQ